MKTYIKKISLSLLFFLSILPSLIAQDWSMVHPFPDYNRFYDGHFQADGTIIIVGSQGRLLKSVNGGQDWIEQDAPINETLKHLHEIPGSNGQEFLLGSESKIFKSTDSGDTWLDVTPDYTFDDLIDIEIVSANIIFASDRTTSVYKSSDGGNTWTDSPFADEHFFWDFSFISEEHGWGLTPQREIYQTTDGGVTWDSIASVPFGAGRGIGFVDSNIGYIAGTSLRFYKTTDGGLTWTEHDEQGYANNVSNFTMVDDSLFYVVNNGGSRLYYTTDAGSNWSVHNATDYVTNKYYKFKLQEDGTLWMLGDFQTVTSSSDGGQTWTDLFPANKFDIPHLRFANENLGFAAGRYSPLLRTDDGGNTWTVANSSGENILGFEIGQDGTLFVSRTYDGVWASTDNGVNWTDLLTDVSAIRTIHLSPGGTLYAASGIAESNIYRSLDNGTSWDTLASPMDWELRGFAFASDAIGFGWEGEHLITTIDGGDSWNPSTIEFTGDVRKMKFRDTQNGWLLSSNRLYKTNDSGETWEEITRPPRGNNLVFQDDLVGWATGGLFNEGNIYKTVDGGQSWDLQFSNDYYYQEIKIVSNDPLKIVAAGNGGVITIFEETVSGVLVPVSANPLSISPNPGNSQIFLDHNFGQEAQLQIFNIQGQLIQQQNIEHTINPRINTSDLITGQYFFRVIEKGNTWYASWIKM